MNTELEPKQNEYRDCPKCGFETFDELSNCPKCSTQLQTESKIRTAGSIQTAGGWMLVIFMSFVGIGLAAMFNYSKYHAEAKTRHNFSQPEASFMMLGAFVLVFTILISGVAFIATGRYAIKHGRRNRQMIKIAVWVICSGLIILSLIKGLSVLVD